MTLAGEYRRLNTILVSHEHNSKNQVSIDGSLLRKKEQWKQTKQKETSDERSDERSGEKVGRNILRDLRGAQSCYDFERVTGATA